MRNETLTGSALIAGGIIYFVVNGILTPLLPTDIPWVEVFASTTFLTRLSLACVSVLLLLVGSLGLFRRQSPHTGWGGLLAYAVLFVGCVMVFAHEWGQVFFLHELAKVAPDGLLALEEQDARNLYDIETILGLVGFMLGWILFAISMLVARVFKPLGPALILLGLLSTPVLGALLPDLWGFVVGNVVLSIGWVVLGRELFNSA